MEAKAREMSATPSPRHTEMNAELDALRRARDQLRVECTELQSKSDDNVSDDESRRYPLHYVYITFLICSVLLPAVELRH